MRISTITTVLLILSLPFFLSGCSISYSGGKSSDSISASLDSISDSSSGGDDSSAASAANNYAEDVIAATADYASNQSGVERFLQVISSIARAHGVVDWEREQLTYTSMGKGLKQADVDEKTIVTLTYFQGLMNRSDYLLVLKSYRQS